MASAHLRMIKIGDDEPTAQYGAWSPDFNDRGELRVVARVAIDKTNADYEFLRMNEWETMSLVHPKLYALTESERSSRRRTTDARAKRWVTCHLKRFLTRER